MPGQSGHYIEWRIILFAGSICYYLHTLYSNLLILDMQKGRGVVAVLQRRGTGEWGADWGISRAVWMTVIGWPQRRKWPQGSVLVNSLRNDATCDCININQTSDKGGCETRFPSACRESIQLWKSDFVVDARQKKVQSNGVFFAS